MPATRPDKLPRWATVLGTHGSGAASRVEPVAARMDAGWPYQEEPAANVQNWLHWETYSWLDYLDQLRSRPATQVVAATDADNESKEAADFKCDGVDDEVQINAAIAALPATGGIVLLTEGTFTLGAATPISLASNLWLRGSGGGTILRPAGGSSGSYAILNAAATVSQLIVSDLEIDGNKAAMSVARGHDAIGLVSPANICLQRLFIHDLSALAGTGRGVQLSGTGSAIVIAEVDVLACNGNGMNLVSSASPSFLRLIGCRIFQAGLSGVLLDANGAVIEACHFQQAGTADGLSISGSSNIVRGCTAVANDDRGLLLTTLANQCIAEGNILSGNGQAGLQVGGNDNLIKGNQSFGNSVTTHNTYNDIHVTGDRNSVKGNITRRAAASPQVKFAIEITAAADATLVSDNDLQEGATLGNAGNAIRNDGTNTVGLPTTATVQQANRQLA